jgi:arabinogalactan oligomer/maltooligosaccharide transport system substrate-binding protein
LLLCLLLIGAILLGGCAQSELPELPQETSILFWHDWRGDDAALLDELIANFHQLRPERNVIDAPLTEVDIAQDFADRFDEGMEPDLLLTDARVAQELIRQGLAKELSAYGVDPGSFNAAALSMVSDGDKIYALPFALSAQLLFYDKRQVPEAPRTLEELRRLTAQPGMAMGLNTSFLEAYWGLRAFGGRSYDSEGRFMLDQGALINWLTALTTIQGAAGFVLNDNQEPLRRQFLQNGLALYVADASEVGVLREALGENLGIAPLPMHDPSNPAGPLLHSSVLLISANAGERETMEALELAQFLTNSQQQSLLAVSDVGHLPAVNSVYLSPSMPEVAVQLATQLGSAVPVTLDQRAVWDAAAEQGQSLYRSVLEGVLDEQQAASQLAAFLAELQPRESGPSLATSCPPLTGSEPLTLTVWHSWSEVETDVLEQLAGEFHTLCPSVAISLTQVSNSTTLNERYRAATQVGAGPHVLIDSTQWTAQLAEDGLIRPLDNDLLPGELAAFIPAAVSAVRVNDLLYAYPESVRSVALIYNPTLVPAPPKTLHELLLQVDSEHPLSMPLTFFYAYWGLTAFGGQIVDEGGVLHFDQAAAGEWISWLRAAARRPGFHFTSGRAEAEHKFLNRQIAFLISGPWSLPRLEAVMPAEEIAISLLPSGPANRASPMLEVEGVMLNANIAKEGAAAALAFARFLSSAPSAETLAATGVHVPANVTAGLTEEPMLEMLGEQAQVAAGVVQDSRWLQVFNAGDELYRSVVLGDADMQAAIAAFAAAIGRAAQPAGADAP